MKTCKYTDCNNLRSKGAGFYCNRHNSKATINKFLIHLYIAMKRRVTNGKNTNTPHLYIGKPIMPKDVFMNWAKNHPDFLAMYKRWVECNFDRKLTPVVNRLHSTGGYTLDNVEWVTNSQNSVMACAVRKMKQKKEIYNLLGVNENVK